MTALRRGDRLVLRRAEPRDLVQRLGPPGVRSARRAASLCIPGDIVVRELALPLERPRRGRHTHRMSSMVDPLTPASTTIVSARQPRRQTCAFPTRAGARVVAIETCAEDEKHACEHIITNATKSPRH